MNTSNPAKAGLVTLGGILTAGFLVAGAAVTVARSLEPTPNCGENIRTIEQSAKIRMGFPLYSDSIVLCKWD